ncbi:hypothetical protein SDC9_199349 [bioreactor metagenome]|uniref:Uncharacterized protein n=1 Tax=bioreactor metagenome TaxID=1076179 RepID=A0A645IKS8_9ZZZZ
MSISTFGRALLAISVYNVHGSGANMAAAVYSCAVPLCPTTE